MHTFIDLIIEDSKRNRKSDDSNKISSLVEQGRFVLAEDRPDCCPETDAVIGRRVTYIGDWSTRDQAELAEEACYKANPDFGEDAEILRIYPEKPDSYPKNKTPF